MLSVHGVLESTGRQRHIEAARRQRLRQSRPPLLLVESALRAQGLQMGTTKAWAFRDGWLDRWHGRPAQQPADFGQFYMAGYHDAGGNRL